MTLRDACVQYGAVLSGKVTYQGVPVDGGLLLWAIAGKESSFGHFREFVKHEPAYMPGGVLYKTSVHLRSLWAKYGVLAASSIGSFQTMFVVAYELGFRQHPIDLQQDAVAAEWAARVVARIIARGATTLEQVFDAYNSGSHKDTIVPTEYMRTACDYYAKGWPKT